MGYNKSLKTVARVQTFLDAMLESTESLTWEVKGDSEKIVVWIREGISASLRHNLPYKTLLQKFTLRARNGLIIAQIKQGVSAIPTDVPSIFQRVVSALIIREPATIESVMTVAIKNNIPEKVQFNHFIYPTSDEEYTRFLEWANGEHYQVYHSPEEERLVLQKGKTDGKITT